MKKIVINADDFGLCDSVNNGIIYCMEKGIVSDLSFIINQPNLNNSIELLKRKKITNIGVHLNFTMGKPNRSLHSSLTNSNGFFFDTQGHFFNYVKGKLNVDEIYEEGKAQIEILISNGFNISHFDSHQNIHILPPFFKAINKLRNEFSPNAYLRIPYEALEAPLNYKLSNLKRIFILNFFSGILKIRHGNKNTIRTIGGDFYNNNQPQNVFRKVIKKIFRSKSLEYELAVHPGFLSDDIFSFDSYVIGREIELNYLSRSNECLEEYNIKIVSFSDLMLNRVT